MMPHRGGSSIFGAHCDRWGEGVVPNVTKQLGVPILMFSFLITDVQKSNFYAVNQRALPCGPV